MGSKDDISPTILLGMPNVVEKADEWNGIKKGDPCTIVDDLSGRYVFVEWFRYANGNECVQLLGGPSGHRQHRFVGADVVVAGSSPVARRIVPGSGPSAPADGPPPAPAGLPTGPEFRARREELRLSRTQLAGVAGTTHAAVASVEAGRSARDKAAPSKMLAALWPEQPAPSDGDRLRAAAALLDLTDAGLDYGDDDDDEDEDEDW